MSGARAVRVPNLDLSGVSTEQLENTLKRLKGNRKTIPNDVFEFYLGIKRVIEKRKTETLA